MLPSLVAGEVRETLLDYLQTTWGLSDSELREALQRFLADDGGEGGSGIFKGPYVWLRLPFQPAAPDAQVPLDIKPPYRPHRHQLEAWQRLSTRDGQEPQPSLVVTGTGSGKTEAFLYPILDHCFRARQAGERGIKAIILYPMNALASDQARRIAQIVWGSDEQPSPMQGRLRVGMYVGGEGTHREMGRDHVIDVGKQLVLDPPDILLTNYKMLDFLLLRPKDRELWQHNSAETLRYLVLDELHTYDGAQGTDVACLIRRLDARLGGAGRFCPVGTSATVSTEEGTSHERLLEFASKVFGKTFERDSIIGETRRTPEDFFSLFRYPSKAGLPQETEPLVPRAGDDIQRYMARVARTWFPESERLGADDEALDTVVLGDLVVRHPAVRSLIRRGCEAISTLDALEQGLSEDVPELAERSPADQRRLVDSMLAMLSWAEREDHAGNRAPLLSVQVQLWIREIRRLVREVSAEPRFLWRDEEPVRKGRPLALPMYYCRSCGHSGWMTIKRELEDRLEQDYTTIGRAQFGRDRDLLYLHTDREALDDPMLEGVEDHVCPKCVRIVREERCRHCRQETVPVFTHQARSQQTPPKDMQRCPVCATDWALSLLASRAATLASVAVGHLYTTPFNDDRKLLAFSDSVQDASHRAGFFSGRTYRFNLRSAMLAAVPEGDSTRLSELGDAMVDRWTEQRSAADVVATFMPRDLQYLESYTNYMEAVRKWRDAAEQENETGSRRRNEPAPPDDLMRDLRKRLRWEATRELGLATRIGRTLERTGCASVHVDPERFEAAVRAIAERVPQRLGLVREVQEPAWRQFVAGVVARLRLRGGVYDELLDRYFKRAGNGAYLTKRLAPLLSPFGRFTSRPIFLTSDPDAEQFDTIQPGKRGNWYSDWATRALGVKVTPGDARDLYWNVLPLLVDAGLMREHGERKRRTWGLEPSALRVSRKVVALRCDRCGQEHTGVEDDPARLEESTCLRYRCTGRLRRAEDASAREPPSGSYYRRFYERQELSRVWASEHTGLLDREEREALETNFKERHRPDAPNMLSCTPTLEMGIDIGDLSTTMLLSVPPTPANYLQRVGRAGRRTGSSLVLTFSTTRPHDLYFFDEPETAMDGPVDPPGCYLDAPEILKRQALAWCFDAWARDGEGGDVLPPQVRQMLQGEERKRFPRPLFEFLQSRRDVLRDRFLQVFGVSESTRGELDAFMSGTGFGASAMEQQLASLVEELVRERDELRRLHRRVRDELKRIEASPEKYERPEELKSDFIREKMFLEKELKELHDRSTLQLLCERSVLPNYAFPETGVTLRAFVAREDDDGNPEGSEQYQWTRAARTAIRELAPFNVFYGSARRIEVDNVDIGDRRGPARGERIARWQLCSQCGHMEPEARLGMQSQCPRCEADDWREQGRRRDLVQMTTVSAFARQREAAFSDEEEDRHSERYVVHRWFDPNPNTAKNAWLDLNTPFGFELLPQLTLREINFGKDISAEGKQRVGGREIPDVAFLVCEGCGQVRSEDERDKRRKGEMRHRRWCNYRNKAEEKQPWRRIHLFREMSSEALRLVLPVSMFDPQRRLPNLRAALELGLRRFFGGDPQHLQVEPHDEPTFISEGARRRYMIIYDVVPGGTGVLAELAQHRGAKLRQVLELAKDAIARCACRARSPDVRACYRCLYAHRHQEDLAVLDRDVALELLERLLEGFDGLESVPTVSALKMDAILESELERRFVARLADWAEEDEDVHWEPEGSERGRLTIGGRTWRLDPQVELHEGHDVPIPCRPDFVFWPEAQEQGVLPVALFADGATYHVRPDDKRGALADDFAKREAILHSGRFRVWSFSWHDMDVLVDDALDIAPWLEREEVRRRAEDVAWRIGENELQDAVRAGLLRDPVRSLAAYLRDPSPQRWSSAAVVTAMAALVTDQRAAERSEVDKLEGRLRRGEEVGALALTATDGDTSWSVARIGGQESIVCLFRAPKDALRRLLDTPDAVTAVMRVDDRASRRAQTMFIERWRQLLRAHNFLQFLPGLATVTTEQLLGPAEVEEEAERSSRPPATPAASAMVADGTASYLTERAQREIEHADESIQELLRRALLSGAPIPEIPYEHADDSGEIVAEIEAGWPSRRVGLYLGSQREAAEQLRADGWKLFEVTPELELAAISKALGLTN